MSDRPLPPDMQVKWGHLEFLRYKGEYSHGPEWSAACPRCGTSNHDPLAGDPDRFMIFGDGGRSGKARGKCRICGHLEWLDDKPVSQSPQQQAQIKQQQVDNALKIERKFQEKTRWLQEQNFWLLFHDEMTREQRRLWNAEGIGDWAIDLHKLGHCQRKEGGAFSIPYLNGDKEILTLQFRLKHPPNDKDKYRWLKGTRPELGHPWPGDPLTKVMLFTEGFKKGIVTFQYGPYEYQGEEITIVSVPMKNFPERLLHGLEDVDRMLWLLDPDADIKQKGSQESMLGRAVRLSGRNRCRVIRAPAKIDDLFAMGLKASTFQNMINQAEPYIRRHQKNGHTQ